MLDRVFVKFFKIQNFFDSLKIRPFYRAKGGAGLSKIVKCPAPRYKKIKRAYRAIKEEKSHF